MGRVHTMFGQSKPIPFEPYGRRRKGLRIPRWLVLLLTGVAFGAGGVVMVQVRYLPPRLTAAESSSLRRAYDGADTDRTRLQRELAEATQKLQAALAERRTMSDELSASHATEARLRSDLASAVALLPPDPRGGAVEVRAGRFAVKGSALLYDLVLTRDHVGSSPQGGAVQFTVSGDLPAGNGATARPSMLAVSLGSQEVLRGSLALADGMRPRLVTIQVLDRPGGRALGMRVLPVK